MPPVGNVHTHFQPESVLALVAPHGIEMTTGPDGKSWYFRSGEVEYLLPTGSTKFWGAGLGSQLEEMDAAGSTSNVLQPSPMIFSYHLEPDVGATFSSAFNDEVARSIEEHPTRFWGSAQLPMQDLELAAAELARAVRELRDEVVLAHVGRLDYHVRVFATGDQALPRPVKDYLSSFYFDTFVHDPRGLPPRPPSHRVPVGLCGAGQAAHPAGALDRLVRRRRREADRADGAAERRGIGRSGSTADAT